MAPSPIRQLLVWSLPSVAVLLSYLWYKKRRIGARSDTGGSKPIEEEFEIVTRQIGAKSEPLNITGSREAKPEKISRARSTPARTPARINRSLSGVETSPIDIVYPRELKTSKSSPVVISDEDLDLEIEKIKSMKTQYNSPSTISAYLSKTPSPCKSEGQKSGSESDEASSPDSKETTISLSPVTKKKESFEQQTVQSIGGKTSPKIATTPKKVKGGGKNNKDKKQVVKSQDGKKMAQKDVVAAVEEKMIALKVSTNNKESAKKESPSKTEKQKPEKTEAHSDSGREIHRKNSGRDSANHSPSDVMLASPSLSSMSDNHSEGSSDSGKGGSDLATPPPSRTPQLTVNSNLPTSYEFVIPQNLVGKLIGRQGCFVQSIKDRCNAQVYVRRHPTSNRLKLCSIEGTQTEIDKALKMIREKFPLKKYYEVTLEQVQLTPLAPSTVSLIPDSLYLKIVEGVNNDTILSCMVSPAHLFMQQPTHPSFPSLSLLSSCMNSCYNAADSPMLPSPIPENTVCAAFSIDCWYRAMVLSSDEETETSYVKFLDYGGYAYVENDKLRQIRQDFMLLPFQAAECLLANVKSKNEDGTWSDEAYSLVADLTKGSIIYTQVADYTPEGVPVVLCYVVPNPREFICLNQKLVDHGFADWVPFEDLPGAAAETSQQQLEEPPAVAV